MITFNYALKIIFLEKKALSADLYLKIQLKSKWIIYDFKNNK